MRYLERWWAVVVVTLGGGCGDSSGLPSSGPPDHLVFITQPTRVLQGVRFAPQIAVELRDSLGTPVRASSLPITLALTNSAAATLQGTTSLTAPLGRATFSDIWVDERARGVQLIASAGSLLTATSDPFDVVAPLPVDKLGAGSEHSCAVTTEGATYCWGRSGSGNIGDSTTFIDRWYPTPVRTDLRFDTVTAGYFTSCGVTSDETAYCWGSNFDGRLGDSTLIDRWTPARLQGNLRFTGQLSGAFFHACGLATDGTAYCWGGNNVGQRGDSTRDFSLALVKVAGGLAFDLLHTVNFHTCGIAVGGAAYCWGSNGFGQVGDSTTTEKLAPQIVYGGRTFLFIVAGFSHTCAIASDTKTYCWGHNHAGQLGNGTTINRLIPVPVSGVQRFTSLTAHGPFTCGLTAQGAAWCWGTSYGSVPKAVQHSEPFVALSAGVQHVCGVTATHRGYCWGVNDNGELGDGTTMSRNAPALVVY